MLVSLHHFFSLMTLALFLLITVRISKIIFFLFLLYVMIVNLMQVNIALHWGGYTGDLSSRVSVAMQSPQSETLEYVHEYIGTLDYAMLGFTLGVLILSVVVLRNYVRPRTNKYIYVVFIVLLAILQNQEPLKTIKYLFSTAQMNKAIFARSNLIQNYKPLSTKEDLGLYDTVVIIQGESANKSFLGVYNNVMHTTPYLDFLLHNGSLYCFNALSASNQTRYSVPTTFTNANVKSWYDGYKKQLSIITDFKENGYETYWFSTQGEKGLHEDSITSIAREADVMRFYGDTKEKDLILLEGLKNTPTKALKSFYVFHIMGSHFSYDERYPKEEHSLSSGVSYVDKYKKSILFTDLFIKKLMTYFQEQNKKLLVIYLSDHGEVVSEVKHGHGYFPSYKEEYEIPFCIYSSIKNPRLDSMYRASKKNIINTENMNYYIKYINGFSDKNNISYATQVFSLDPKNIIDYRELNKYENK